MNVADVTEPWILGISCSHNGSACLLRGERLVVAMQEERLVRAKRQRTFGAYPSLCVDYCLQAAGIGPDSLDLVVVCTQGKSSSRMQDPFLNRQLRVGARNIQLLQVPHHVCHAISAFATSGVGSADVLVMDGTGSPLADLLPDEVGVVIDTKRGDEVWETHSCYHVDRDGIRPLLKQMAHRDDREYEGLGRLYETISSMIFEARQ